MILRKLSAALSVVALAAVGFAGVAAAAEAPAAKASVDDARMGMRTLWVEHIFWVRNYVVANQDKNEAAKKVAVDEVVANAKKLAGSIEPFYGKAASDQLFTLLAGHWGAIKAVSDATVASDANSRAAGMTGLTDNAKAIAKFLSGANPNLPYDALFAALAAHGAHHVAQIDQLHAGNYAGEAKTCAQMRDHVLVIADTLVKGIAAQFPDKF